MGGLAVCQGGGLAVCQGGSGCVSAGGGVESLIDSLAGLSH